jgi:hypothetical protein
MPRDFNTPIREPWNASIYRTLKTIDLHTFLYLKTGDIWHEEQAQILRKYLTDLKDWIILEETK